MDIGDVDGETIERVGLKDKEFEHFVKRLLKAERALRHRADTDIQGPVSAYRGDDKRDLVFVVHGQPRVSRTHFTAALTWDEVAATWYSCKGGGSWYDSILTELGRAAYNRFKKDHTVPGLKRTNRPSKRLLDHIEAGGRYVFVIAVAAIDDRRLLDNVAAQLGFWLDYERRQKPKQLRDQLGFVDANRLADFVSTHKPELSAEQRKGLNLDEPPGLKPWRQWTDELGVGRDLPDFEADAERKALFVAIANPEHRVLRIFGAPGVGKTRVVHEGIRLCGPDAQERTLYSDEVNVSLQVVQDAWLRTGGKPWLVLDELRSADVEQLVAKFEANAGVGARLILVGPSDAQAHAIPNRAFHITELDEEQTRRLIAKEATSLLDAQREAIWQLSEGYPWYAVLLARAVAIDDEALEHGDDDATRWFYGTQRVLAGNPADYESVSVWEREAELRAKTLLVAMLTRDVELSWDELCERESESLRRAIGEPEAWNEVVSRERVCRSRQLLRQSGLGAIRRYVSPNNLARLILHHFLTDPDLGPKIHRYAPGLRSTLVAIAKAVRVKPSLIEQLARCEWDELERRACAEGLDAVEAYVRFGDPTYEAARDVPEFAATTMAAVIARYSADELRGAGNLRAVAAFVFQHVVHRKISQQAFLAVESALISLARVDDSPFANSSSGIWKSLFLPGLHATHQPWELRHRRLEERLALPDIFVRRLAIDALGRAVDPREHGLGHTDNDKVDGEWPAPSMAEYIERKTQLWAQLLPACEDRDRELAARAQSVVARGIRDGLGRGLDVATTLCLAQQVRNWHPQQRRELLEKIANIHRYDALDYAELPDLLDALQELEQAAAPLELVERVRVQIGTWRPGPWQITDPERPKHEAANDVELAQALLDDPQALAWGLKWSTSPEAVRASALWFALGRADRGAGLHRRLVAEMREGFPAVGLAQYLLGWAEEDSVANVEAWLFSAGLADDVELSAAAQWFLVVQEPTRARLECIRELVDAGAVAPQALIKLVFRGWQQLELDVLLDFLKVTERDELAELSLHLGGALLDRELNSTQREAVLEHLRATLERAFTQRVEIGMQDIATKVSLALADAGHIEFLASIVVHAFTIGSNGQNVHLGDELLVALLKAGYGPALWPVLTEALMSQVTHGSSLQWQLARNHLLAHVPQSTVLDWVGDDQRRAVAVASLTSPYHEQLDPLAQQLLVRFGAEGLVGDGLQNRALSTPSAIVGGVNTFHQRQLSNAQAWRAGAAPAVERWARDLAALLSAQVREHEARAELHTKYG